MKKNLFYSFLLILFLFSNTFAQHDLFIPTIEAWRSEVKEFTIPNDNSIVTNQPIIGRYLHGEVNKSQYESRLPGPIIFYVNYPVDGELLFFVERASVDGRLAIYLDDEKIREIHLPAGPGKGPWESVNYLPQYDVYQALYNREYRISVPGGKHTIRLQNEGRDWLTINYFVFTNYANETVSPTYEKWKEYSKDVAALPDRINNYQAKIKQFEKSLNGDPNAVVIATLKLQLENLIKLSHNYKTMDLDLMRTEDELTEIFDYIRERKDYIGLKRNRIKLAYVSEVDSSIQPYDIMIPPDYDPDKQYPLIVHLHGYLQDIQKYTNFLGSDKDSHLDSLDVIKVAVYGRRNCSYHGVAENDVFRVMQEVRQLYSIDQERIYLVGDSMGGYGTWRIGLNYPDQFAAISPVCAPALGGRRADMFSPEAYVQNAHHLPVRIYHGALDPSVNVRNSRVMYAHLQKLENSHLYKYIEYPDVAHDCWNNANADKTRIPTMLKYKRQKWPETISHKIFFLRYGKAYWLEITGKAKWDDFATIDAAVTSPHEVQIITKNVSEFSLVINNPLIKTAKNIDIEIDNNKFKGDRRQKKLTFHKTKDNKWKLGKAPSSKLTKQKFMEGPWSDAEKNSYVIVYGTASPEASNRLKAIGENILAIYQHYDNTPKLIPDTLALKENITSTYNIHLLGTPAENRYLEAISANLPVSFETDQFNFIKKYSYDIHGLRMIYPNPQNRQRYVLLDIFPTGLSNYSDAIQLGVMDYLVYSIKKEQPKVHQEGFFNSFWELD